MRKLLFLFCAALLVGGQAAPPELDGEKPIVSDGDFSLSLQSAPTAVLFLARPRPMTGRFPLHLHGRSGAARRSDRLSGTTWQIAPPPILRQRGGERLLELRHAPKRRKQHLQPWSVRSQPFGLLDAGHARRGREVVKPAFVSIYYKRRPASDPKCSIIKRQSPSRRRLRCRSRMASSSSSATTC